MGDSSFRRHGLHTGPFARRAKVPWKECNQMDERLKFIARLLDGEKMAVLCRQFGISRKTGYKILTRYNEIGLEGLTDRSRRPYRHANQNSLLTGNLTGNFSNLGLFLRFSLLINKQIQMLAAKFLANGTGNFFDGTGNYFCRTGNSRARIGNWTSDQFFDRTPVSNRVQTH